MPDRCYAMLPYCIWKGSCYFFLFCPLSPLHSIMKYLRHIQYFSLSVWVFMFIQASAQQDEFQDFKGFSAPKSSHNSGLLKADLIPLLLGQMPFTGELRLTYERQITKNRSLTIGASLQLPQFHSSGCG